jgi:AcrR family transcriptional regulator
VERTADTRARLIEATLDLVFSKGYASTTMVEIAARAGLTRGALSHHFEGKDQLIVEAFAHLLRSTTEEIRTYASQVELGTMSLADFVDSLWKIFSGPFFMVTLEQITASRHNVYLRERLVERTRDFQRSLDEIWRQFFSGTAMPSAEVETTFNATLCLLRGMGVQTVLRDDPAYYRRLLTFWKSVLAQQIERPAAFPTPRSRLK